MEGVVRDSRGETEITIQDARDGPIAYDADILKNTLRNILPAFCSDWADITTHSVRESLSERHSPLAGSPHNGTHHPVGLTPRADSHLHIDHSCESQLAYVFIIFRARL